MYVYIHMYHAHIYIHTNLLLSVFVISLGLNKFGKHSCICVHICVGTDKSNDLDHFAK